METIRTYADFKEVFDKAEHKESIQILNLPKETIETYMAMYSMDRQIKMDLSQGRNGEWELMLIFKNPEDHEEY